VAPDICGDRLLGLLLPWIERGQLSFANRLRRCLYLSAPDVFALVDFDDDGTFLDPAAFVYAAAGRAPVLDARLLWLHAIPADRKPLTITARADGLGRVFLPGLGYLSGLPPSAPVSLKRDPASSVGYSPRGSSATITPLTRWRLGPSLPSLLPYPVRDFGHALSADGGALRHLHEATCAHRDALAKALRRIQRSWPALAKAIGSVVRHLTMFDDNSRNSFAAGAAHGIACLNTAHGSSAPFFVEDLAHQCGHVLFLAALEGADPMFTVAPDCPVAQLTHQEDHRTLIVAMHGMVTEVLIVGALEHMLVADAGSDRHEAIGRLLFAVTRLGLDLRRLAGLPIYSAAGERILHELIASYTRAASRYRDLLRTTDLTDQDYNFNYDTYRASNSILVVAPA
jgi:hypothetical protein